MSSVFWTLLGFLRIKRLSILFASSLIIISISFLSSCSNKDVLSISSKKFSVPVTVLYNIPRSLNLEEGDSTNLNLVTTATNLVISVSNCSSGYSISPASISSGLVNLYNGDPNCLVKLTSFTIGSTTYSATGGTDFTSWLNNDVATFKDTGSASTIKVFVNSQVTQAGVQLSDTVVYKFTDIASSTASDLSTSVVSTPVPLSASGQPAPDFTLTQTRYLSTNPNGSANMSFTLQCGSSMTGSSIPTYACSSILLNSQLDYILIPDVYSQAALTVAQANSAFSSNTPTSVGSLIVAPGASDLNSNTLTNGGFYTSNDSPLTPGSNPIVPDNLNSVFILRSRDTSGNTLAYLYFYVVIPTLTQTTTVSGCGTTFSGGDGSVGNPYQVANLSDLTHTTFCTSSSAYFIQTANIDLGGSSSPWTPITLYGRYDGNGYTISNLYINNTVGGNLGLFSTINSGALATEITLNNVSITSTVGGVSMGAVAGTLNGSTSYCSSSGTLSVTGNGGSSLGGIIGVANSGASISHVSSTANLSYVITPTSTQQRLMMGGIVAYLNSASLSYASYTGTITASGNNTTGGASYTGVGGLVGYMKWAGASLSYSYSNATITLAPAATTTSLQEYGGAVGRHEFAGLIQRVFATGSISLNGSNNTGLGPLNYGGFSGREQNVTNSYSMMTISLTNTSGFGTINYGGFAGTSASGTGISNSYAANPSMTATSAPTGLGFVGSGISTCTNCYLYANGNVPAQTLTGLTSYTTTTQMQTQSNFAFDFSTPIWKMPSANPLSPSGLLSPVLYWQCGANGIVCP